MLHLGSFLKQAREDKGLTLEDMQELTKIKTGYIEAIEKGNYDALPGLFYVRAFVKTYCEALGLPAAEVMDIYQSDLPGGSAPTAKQITDQQDSGPSMLEPKGENFFAKWGSSMIIWSLAIIILLAVYFLITGTGSDEPAGGKQTNKPAVESSDSKASNSTPTGSTEGELVVEKNDVPPPANETGDAAIADQSDRPSEGVTGTQSESNATTVTDSTNQQAGDRTDRTADEGTSSDDNISNQTDNDLPASGTPSNTDNDTDSPAATDSADSSGDVRLVSKEGTSKTYAINKSNKVVIQITATEECYVHYGPKDKSKIYSIKTLKPGESVTWDNDADTLLRTGAAEKMKLTVNGEPVDLSDLGGPRTLLFDLNE